MPTSNVPTLPTRSPLRLLMADPTGRTRLDGGWWPQSRDLTVELADLVDHFPPEVGRVSRALVSPPDWDEPPDRVPVASGHVVVKAFPHDDRHVVDLTLTDHRLLRLLVVPADLSAGQGEEALLGGGHAGQRPHSATSILETLPRIRGRRPQRPVERRGRLVVGPNIPIAPSFRDREIARSR